MSRDYIYPFSAPYDQFKGGLEGGSRWIFCELLSIWDDLGRYHPYDTLPSQIIENFTEELPLVSHLAASLRCVDVIATNCEFTTTTLLLLLSLSSGECVCIGRLQYLQSLLLFLLLVPMEVNDDKSLAFFSSSSYKYTREKFENDDG